MDYLLIIIGILLVLFIYALVGLNNNYSSIIKSNKNIATELNKYKTLLEKTEKELQNQIQKCSENKPILKTTVCKKPIITSAGFLDNVLVLSGENFNKTINIITLTKNNGEQIILNDITSPSTFRIEIPNLENIEYTIQIKSVYSNINCFSISDEFKYLPDLPGPIINKIFLVRLLHRLSSYITTKGLFADVDFIIEGYNFTPDTIIKATHINGLEFDIVPNIIAKNYLTFNISITPPNNITTENYMDDYSLTLEIISNNQYISTKLSYNLSFIQNPSIRYRILGYKDYYEQEKPPEIIYFD